MPSQIKLSRERSDLLRECIRTAGLQQKALAALIGVHPSTLSLVLSCERPIECRDLQKLEEKLGSDLQRSIDSGDVDSATGEKLLSDLRSHEGPAEVGFASPEFSEPLDAVPEDAPNFVRTEAWHYLEHVVLRRNPCVLRIVGPILSGKTTLMRFLYVSAFKRGAKAAVIDCRALASEKTRAADLTWDDVCRELQTQIKVGFDLSDPRSWQNTGARDTPISPGSFKLWLQGALRESKKQERFLLIDTVNALSPQVQEKLVRGFARGFAQEINKERLDIWLVLAYTRSSLEFWNTCQPGSTESSDGFGQELTLNWFDDEQKHHEFSQLTSSYGLSTGDSRDLYKVTNGQPFLSQCWLNDWRHSRTKPTDLEAYFQDWHGRKAEFINRVVAIVSEIDRAKTAIFERKQSVDDNKVLSFLHESLCFTPVANSALRTRVAPREIRHIFNTQLIDYLSTDPHKSFIKSLLHRCEGLSK